ncbi:MAG: hypothetical protein QXK37_01810 [Candidatus Woesearchaeota archaeon]
MEELEVLEGLFDKKVIRILKVFFRDRTKQFYLQEVSEQSNVPIATTSRILNKFAKNDIIEVQKVSRIKLYRLKGGKKTDFLGEIFKEDTHIIKLFISHVSKMPGIRRIILHGREQKDRANILLIGEGLDHGEIKRICAEIRDKYKFLISDLSLTEEQYYQMTSMGLYQGEKRVLFER